MTVGGVKSVIRPIRSLNTSNCMSSVVSMHLTSHPRYILSMTVADWSGQAWLQGFNDSGVVIFENSADKVIKVKVCTASTSIY